MRCCFGLFSTCTFVPVALFIEFPILCKFVSMLFCLLFIAAYGTLIVCSKAMSSFILYAAFLIRTISISTFMPVVCLVIAIFSISMAMSGRGYSPNITACIAGCILVVIIVMRRFTIL